MDKKKIVILGATGSIGESAFQVVLGLPDRLQVVGLAGGGNWRRLAEQADRLGVRHVALADASRLASLQRAVGKRVRATATTEGLCEMVAAPDVDLVLCAISGTAGFEPVLAAIQAGKDIALASKEILVMAGRLVMAEVRRHGVRMIPVDSEHSAIFQCLEGRTTASVERLILTASGGPFRQASLAELAAVTPARALAHPTWNMGPKITIDSATLFNKALEVIEARWLFGIDGERIDVVVHPQSIVHSMVEFVDGGLLAQLGAPDMRLPIQYALLHPERLATGLPKWHPANGEPLTFLAPDHERFPALRLARKALLAGGTMPTVLNAANEIAVDAFRQERLPFPGIWQTVASVMADHAPRPQAGLNEILAADHWARRAAEDKILGLAHE